MMSGLARRSRSRSAHNVGVRKFSETRRAKDTKPFSVVSGLELAEAAKRQRELEALQQQRQRAADLAEACPHFLRGVCAFGASCRKKHPVGMAPPMVPGFNGAPPSICVHFMQGRCSFGNSCRNLHPATPVQMATWASALQQQGSSVGSKPCLNGTSCRWAGCCFAHPGQKPGDPPPGGWGPASPAMAWELKTTDASARTLECTGVVRSVSRECAYISPSDASVTSGCDVFVPNDEMGDIKVGEDVSFRLVLIDGHPPRAKQVRKTPPAAVPSGEDLYDPFAAPEVDDVSADVASVKASSAYDPFEVPTTVVPSAGKESTQPRVNNSTRGVGSSMEEFAVVD